MEKKFYVYVHIRPDTGAVFYVGKGCGKRAWSFHPQGRSEHHARVVEKLRRNGFKVEVRLLAKNLTDEESKTIEVNTIAAFKAFGCSLINKTIGGDGATGYEHDEKSRKKMSNSQLARFSDPIEKEKAKDAAARRAADPAVIQSMREGSQRRWSKQEEREKAAAAQKKRFEKEEERKKAREKSVKLWEDPEYRKKGSEITAALWKTPEYREKMRKANEKKWADPELRKRASESKNNQKKPVLCLDNGVVYESTTAAAKALGIHQAGVSGVCLGRQNKTGGYRFRYA